MCDNKLEGGIITVVKELKHYISGKWTNFSASESVNVMNPANQAIIAKAPSATTEETDYSINVAKKTFESGVWSEMSEQKRSVVMFQIASKLEEHIEELTNLEVENNGKTYREAYSDALESINTFRYYASILQTSHEDIHEAPDNMQTMVIKESIGVAGLIVPWNFPLLMSNWKIAPALAAGNSILLKPAEITPMTAVRIFELIDETDLPKGVANLVMGKGSIVGQTMAESMDVDMISFTGSTTVGRSIMQSATSNMKKISLELGGKSPNIIFADADFETAIDYALFGIFMGAGQVCSSGSRIIVQESIYDSFVHHFIERAKHIRTGPGNSQKSEMGAIVSKEHMISILDYVQIGKDEGATLALGGNRLVENGLDKGFFIEPTVFTNVTSEMRIAKEEIFGPVVTIQKFTDEKEAINIANATNYGLAGAVFSQDYNKAYRVIRKVKAGITWINNYHLTDVKSPWGGYKQSGIGRGLGKAGLHEYQEIKQINMKLDSKPIRWFK